MSKKGFIKFLKKQWILVWLILATLALITIISFAEYKDANNRLKRVFVASKQVNKLFTSNYLISGTNQNSVLFNENSDKIYSFGVYLRNYDPSVIGSVFDGSITYTLSAALAHKNCNAYTASETDDLAAWNSQNMQIQISYGLNTLTLSGNTLSDSVSGIVLTDTDSLGEGSGKRNVHQWNVTFTNVPLDSDYCVTLTATPTYNADDTITSTLGVASFPESKTEGWTCTLVDDKSKDINKYDAFNFMLTGDGGVKLKFSYDSAKLVLNPVFCSYNAGCVLNDSTETQGWKTLEITVSTVRQYDLQLYKVNGSSPSSWDDLLSWIKFEIVSD